MNGTGTSTPRSTRRWNGRKCWRNYIIKQRFCTGASEMTRTLDSCSMAYCDYLNELQRNDDFSSSDLMKQKKTRCLTRLGVFATNLMAVREYPGSPSQVYSDNLHSHLEATGKEHPGKKAHPGESRATRRSSGSSLRCLRLQVRRIRCPRSIYSSENRISTILLQHPRY
jgi:hypothetical protein